MAVTRTLTLNVPASTTTGTALEIGQFAGFSVHLSGTFVASIQLQLSPDGTAWINEGSALTTTGVTHITKLAKQIRAVVTFTSGAPVGQIVGLYAEAGG
jgi:hypothetical protein